MLSIKNGSYTLEEFRAYAQQRFETAEKLMDAYKAFEPDTETKEELDLLVTDLVRDGISEEFGQVRASSRRARVFRTFGVIPVEFILYGPSKNAIRGSDRPRVLMHPKGHADPARYSGVLY